jgi:hypothetical protein
MEPSLILLYILIDVEHWSAVPIMIQILCSAKLRGECGAKEEVCPALRLGLRVGTVWIVAATGVLV